MYRRAPSKEPPRPALPISILDVQAALPRTSSAECHPGAARELLTNAIYLEHSGTELAGLKIWGSPVQPEFNNWAFNVARGAAIRRYWQMIPASTDVLITHGQPFGILDTAHPTTAHLGCKELAKAVQQIRPRLHVFGHIHGGQGQRNSDGTRYISASVVNEVYQLVYAPQVIEIDVSLEKERTRSSTDRSMVIRANLTFPGYNSVAEAQSASRLCDCVAAGGGPALTQTLSVSAYHSRYSGGGGAYIQEHLVHSRRNVTIMPSYAKTAISWLYKCFSEFRGHKDHQECNCAWRYECWRFQSSRPWALSTAVPRLRTKRKR